eukprot:TRINITY_DN4514_c0_g1_i1.p1 TRINITY_DN4514_c0_g1~~TRINITY_DN4514_c0_g1_i1.p1  ORF type:complete len:218 (-),score=43.68 TRINITY_DN4514_c0_g1_i1:56-649(-)
MASVESPLQTTLSFYHVCSGPNCRYLDSASSLFPLCSRCLNVSYHTPDCQKKHWKHGESGSSLPHKILCQATPPDQRRKELVKQWIQANIEPKLLDELAPTFSKLAAMNEQMVLFVEDVKMEVKYPLGKQSPTHSLSFAILREYQGSGIAEIRTTFHRALQRAEQSDPTYIACCLLIFQQFDLMVMVEASRASTPSE